MALTVPIASAHRQRAASNAVTSVQVCKLSKPPCSCVPSSCRGTRHPCRRALLGHGALPSRQGARTGRWSSLRQAQVAHLSVTCCCCCVSAPREVDGTHMHIWRRQRPPRYQRDTSTDISRGRLAGTAKVPGLHGEQDCHDNPDSLKWCPSAGAVGERVSVLVRSQQVKHLISVRAACPRSLQTTLCEQCLIEWCSHRQTLL